MYVVGIDPGLTGAIAVVDHSNGALVSVVDMPVEKRPNGKSRVWAEGVAIECVSIMEGLNQSSHNIPVNLEAVHSSPQMGVTSAFNFGDGFGALRGVLGAFNFSVSFVTPQVWKLSQGVIRQDKDYARLKVLDLYPEQAHLFKRKKDGGRADAVLIGRHGYCEQGKILASFDQV